ncbi:MAG TPA: penicillin acylase family protein [Nocardioidaceae bacterium]|nr:penicillin acylase family protein [Nocardioidaceae bacterium]
MTFELFRDDYGIPHVRADSVNDLGFGQGHTAAMDRAWQLDLERLRAEGRVAELVGQPGVEWDTFARRARIEHTARRAFSRLSDETRAFVSAFADGVNAGLEAAPEHEALKATPGRWQHWTPVSVFLAQHLLFATYPSKLWRHQVRKHLGDEGLVWFGREGMPMSGSNAFAVTGSRTESGLPLIAGDPHRMFEAPNVYAQVHLACPEFDVVGFAFPGVPGIQHFAHAGSVAWAITNAMADYQDLYVEHLDGTEERHTEQIDVRDGAAVEVEVIVTARGPVIIEGEETYSLRTPSYVCEDLGFEALLPLLRSKTAGDVDAAFAHWVEPVNNVVIADVHGEVLHRVAGKVPLRPSDNMVTPVGIENEWQGWVTDLPRTSPVEGAIVTANNRVSDEYDRIGNDFSAPHRANRIRALLGDRTALTVEDLATILTDTYSIKAGGEMREVGAAYLAGRDAVVARLLERADFAPLGAGSPYGRLYGSWFNLPGRIAQALPVGVVEPGDPKPPLTFHPLHGLEQLGVAHQLVDDLHEATRVPVYGESDCIQAMRVIPGVAVCSGGPVARYVWDLADRSRSRWVVPLGASGAPGRPHHHDQLALWADGELAPVVTDWDQLTKET